MLYLNHKSKLYHAALEGTKAPLWHIFSPKLYDVLLTDSAYSLYKKNACGFEIANHDAFRLESLEQRHLSKKILTDSDVLKLIFEYKQV